MPEAHNHLAEYLKALKQSGFEGDYETSYGARIVAATDNSVYQVVPDAILYPATGEDIQRIVAVLRQHQDSGISITPRGGGTGTNGQSLNRSVIVDTSRHLRNIIHFDEPSRQVCVEPGVVLDQLNAYLKPYGLFFPAEVSTASRATIGGMVATDASGKGSRIYGKTSAYIEQLDVVLADGSEYRVRAIPIDKLGLASEQSLGDRLQYEVYWAVTQHREEIDRVFPDLNRGLTGYNLKQVLGDDGQFRMSYLLAGSEGTLAFTRSITLRLLPIPKCKALLVVLYDDYLKALRHVEELCESEPAAIEIIDDKIIRQAQRDMIWQEIEAVFRNQPLGQSLKAMNFIEIIAQDEASLQQQCDKLSAHIERSAKAFGVMSTLVETGSAQIASLWNLRSRAVGLLATLEGKTQGLAFVEDSTVPQQYLADYVEEFRAILDDHQVDYAMYGHADVGCLHVRPMLDMTQQADRDMIRSISDRVAALVKRYGGLLWGEHGRGFRGEYSPLFFGAHLMPVLQQIKTAFDPHNIFNPGKLTVPQGSPITVTKIDEVPFRGSFDEQIKPDWSSRYQAAIACNGNAACFSWQLDDAMCPSYKVTKDKTLSPKGRAAMLREWARLESTEADFGAIASLEAEIFHSLNACLSCKSCAYTCPLKVDIPELKSLFLEHYYRHHERKPRDRLMANLERLAGIARMAPGLANLLIQRRFGSALMKSLFQFISPPRFSVSLRAGLWRRKAIRLKLKKLPVAQSFGDKTLILLSDSFNASFSSEVLLAAYDLLERLGYKVLLAPVLDNGKALHVRGFRIEFKRLANRHVEQMRKLAATGLPLISVEVVTRLMHDKEYAEILQQPPGYQVWSIESWLAQQIEAGHLDAVSLGKRSESDAEDCLLLPHCMEQSADRQSAQDWQTVFEFLGLSLTTRAAGCCGMAGLFGHERENQQMSRDIFSLNWQPIADNHNGKLLASGFSCRCQLQKHGFQVQHPLTLLNQ
ncbi:MAG: FAD-binding oxidoreductase [Proteobacteria bacterium]|nr:FAD-binding oxidoreductase [Pseudomonadota bacterium]